MENNNDELVVVKKEDIKDRLYDSLTQTFDMLDHVKYQLSCIYEGVAKDMDIREANHIHPMEKQLNKYRETLFLVLNRYRNELYEQFQDWKDVDDFVFSRLDLTEAEVHDIYRGRGYVFTGSCKKE